MIVDKQAGNKPLSYPNNATAAEINQVKEGAIEVNTTKTTPSPSPFYNPSNTPCHELIRVFLMHYGISDDWRKYEFYVVSSQGEKIFALDEKPLQIVTTRKYQDGTSFLRRVDLVSDSLVN